MRSVKIYVFRVNILRMDIGHYVLAVFIAIAGAVILLSSLKPVLKVSVLVIAIPLMGQLWRCIFGLSSNVPAVCCL